jgi:speckle-type POZ protein
VKYITMAYSAQMIVPYQWILNVVEEEPKTIASKMIIFRGERVFRVGLKNHAQSPILLFLAADLNKIGMRVEDVMYGVEDADTCPATMTQMKREDKIGIDGSLQLFTIKLVEMVTGQRTFVFRICIKGNVPGYSYRLSDRLGKDQLWAAKDNPNLADVEFIVKGQKLLANKSILAARSHVFAAELTKEQPVREGRHQIRIDGVEPSTVEQFLHFIYTGEPMSSLANEQRLMLAEKYGLTTLIKLCQVALKKIETKQMMNFLDSNKKSEIPPPSEIR